jgi:hypothetical protein
MFVLYPIHSINPLPIHPNSYFPVIRGLNKLLQFEARSVYSPHPMELIAETRIGLSLAGRKFLLILLFH